MYTWSPERRRFLDARVLLAFGWWILLGAVVWACFLRPPPRSLARTTEDLVLDPAWPVAVAAALLLVGAYRCRRRRPLLALVSFAGGALPLAGGAAAVFG